MANQDNATTIPMVSVIIPTYNRAQTIERSVNSVLNQTFPDFELIIVDDCSTDNTLEILAKYHDKRVSVIRHDKNRGEGGARNTGIRNARAKYVAFLDSDDEWLPEKLSKQLPLIQKSSPELGIIYSHYIMQYNDGSGKSIQRPSMRGKVFANLLTGDCFLPSTAIIRRECFDRHMHDEHLPSFQDWDLWLRISRDYIIDYIPEPLCIIYLGTPIQATRDISARLNGLNLVLDKWDELISHNLGESELRRMRDNKISALYVVISEDMKLGDRLSALKIFFQLALRNNDFYRGPSERKAIIYNLSLIMLGGRFHGFIKGYVKRIW